MLKAVSSAPTAPESEWDTFYGEMYDEGGEDAAYNGQDVLLAARPTLHLHALQQRPQWRWWRRK